MTIEVVDGHGVLNLAGITAEQRAALSPERADLLDALELAIEHEQHIASEAKTMPDAIWKARQKLAAAQKHLSFVRPPVSQADLLRQQIIQERRDRNLPLPDALKTV